jgi:hypothetical protein
MSRNPIGYVPNWKDFESPSASKNVGKTCGGRDERAEGRVQGEAEKRKRSNNCVEYLMKGKITKFDNVYPMSPLVHLHRVLEQFTFWLCYEW